MSWLHNAVPMTAGDELYLLNRINLVQLRVDKLVDEGKPADKALIDTVRDMLIKKAERSSEND
ncbi:unnamed protein product [marine sediment metagenome]|uniref:Uncharacterized protein n=1 Tax=marine sediment metagenome TaxID=412755 RepID=X1S5N7_9ZZZZ